MTQPNHTDPIATLWPNSSFRIDHWRKHHGGSPILNQVGKGRLKNSAVWIVTLVGRATMEVSGLRHILEPGTILSIQSHKQGRITQATHYENWTYLVIALSGEPALRYFEYLNSVYGFANRIPIDAKPITSAVSISQDIANEKQLCAHHWSKRAHDWLSCWSEYIESNRLPLSTILDLQKGDPVILDYVGRSVKEITQAKGCSRTLIGRHINDKWEAPLAKILQTLRIELARLYLRDSKLRVHEISLKVGYSSLSALTHAFKKAVGKNPLEYRKHSQTITTETSEFLNISYSNLEALEERLRINRSQIIADRQQTAIDGMDVNSVFSTSDRPRRPFFSLGLSHKRNRIASPIEMTLEPFRKKVFFTYTLSGTAALHWKNKTHELTPGQLIVHPTPANISFVPYADSPKWERVTIALFGHQATEKFETVVQEFGYLSEIPRQSRAIELLHEIHDANFQITPAARSRLIFDFLTEWHLYLDTHGNALKKTVDFSDCESRVIPYHSVKNVRQLAQEVGYSRSHFSRKLRKQWQTATPGGVIRSGKLAIASKLLKDTNLPISRVASNVGYSSVAGFIGAFKKQYKQTPLRYRRAAH